MSLCRDEDGDKQGEQDGTRSEEEGRSGDDRLLRDRRDVDSADVNKYQTATNII